MARLFTSCFGLNSLTAGMEFDAAVGGTIASVTMPSGNSGLAGKISSLASGTNQRFRIQFSAAGANGPFFFRFYFQYTTAPSAENRIFALSSSATAGTSVDAYMTLDNGGLLRLYDDVGVIGSPSSALTNGTWYRVEVWFDRTKASGSRILKGLINGVIFASGTSQIFTTSINHVYWGGNLNSEAQTTGVWYFTNLAINDTTGTSQRSLPGAGNVILLSPNAAGDINTFATQVGGTAGSANNYTRVNEIPPNDATSYNGSTTLSEEDLFNVANSGIAASSTISLVAVGMRFANITAADATASFKVEIIKTSGGTKLQSSAIIPNSTTWKTNATATPLITPITAYTNPDGQAWNQTTVDSMQIGYILSVANTRVVAISNVFALVEYNASTTSNFMQVM